MTHIPPQRGAVFQRPTATNSEVVVAVGHFFRVELLYRSHAVEFDHAHIPTTQPCRVYVHKYRHILSYEYSDLNNTSETISLISHFLISGLKKVLDRTNPQENIIM